MIKIGDKVKSINKEGISVVHNIRVGRIYDVYGFFKDNIEIIRDDGTIFGYKKERFEKVG